MPLAQDALRNEIAALRQAPGPEVSGTNWAIEQMQVLRRHRTPPESCQQNIGVEKKARQPHRSHATAIAPTASTGKPWSGAQYYCADPNLAIHRRGLLGASLNARI